MLHYIPFFFIKSVNIVENRIGTKNDENNLQLLINVKLIFRKSLIIFLLNEGSGNINTPSSKLKKEIMYICLVVILKPNNPNKKGKTKQQQIKSAIKNTYKTLQPCEDSMKTATKKTIIKYKFEEDFKE